MASDTYTHYRRGISIRTGAYAFGAKGSETILFGCAAGTTASAANNYFNMGAVVSSSGSNFAVSSTRAQTMFVGADDGGAAIGSGTHVAAARFRTLLTYTSGNREQEVSSVRGQLVSKNGTNRHNMCAVLGSYEVNTGLTVDGQAWATDPWPQAGVMARVGAGSGITTINANGILCGFAAMSGTTSFAANNGTYTGLFVGKWASTLDWAYGIVMDAAAIGTACIYVPGGTAVKGLQFGTLSSTTPGSGFTLSDSVTRILEVNADDNNSSLTTSTLARAIMARYMVYANSSNENWGVDGLLKWSAVAHTGNVHAGVVGRFESTGTCSTASGSGNTYVAGLMGRIGGGGTFTIGAGTLVCGVLAFYNTTTTNAFTNTGTAGFAVAASAIAGVGDWDYGLYVQSDNAAVGVYVGDTSGNSIQVVNTNLTTGDNYSGVRVAVTTATGPNNEYGAAAYFDSTLTGTNGGHFYNVGSWINFASGYTPAASKIHAPYEGGVYDGGGTLTNCRIVLCQLQAILSSNPNTLHIFRVNYNRGTGADAITAVFQAANAGSIGYTAGSGTSGTQLGYIPIANIVGTGVVYIRVYDSAS